MDLLSVISVFSGLLSAVSATAGIVIAVRTSRAREDLLREFQRAQGQIARENLKLTMDAKMMNWRARVLHCLNEIELFIKIPASRRRSGVTERQSELPSLMNLTKAA